MRRATVDTHYRCNQACVFCDRRKSVDDPRFIAGDAVRRRIDRVLEAGARAIVFSGGEPTMRQDLAALAASASKAGALEVWLETNATLIDSARARELRDAGVTRVIVHLPAWGETLDRLTRDPGGFDRAIAGLDALLGAGCDVDIAVTLVRSTAATLAGLPALLRARFGERTPRTILVAVPLTSPDPNELLDYVVVTATVTALYAAAQAVGIDVRFSTESAPPPCTFSAPKRHVQLFTLAPGQHERDGYERVEACAECLVSDRCPGFASTYLARFGLPPVAPIQEERSRRRLTLIDSTERQLRRELVTHNFHQRDATREEIIRVQFQCNQSCRFCFVSTHLPDPDEAWVREAITAAAARGSRIVLSGGEPTLNARLLDYVRLARRLSDQVIELQTNAIRLADPAFTDALVAAGVGRAFVSLHGSTSLVSDAVTEAPGTFARTVSGIDELARRSVEVVLNFVLCQANRHDLTNWVELAAARWPKAILTFSFVAPSSDLVPRDRATIPSYTDALPEVARARAAAERLAMTLLGFESMCGLPLCLVPDGLALADELSRLPDGIDAGEFVRAEACEGCALASRCYGIRRGYAAIYGTAELRRVAST